MLACQIRQAAVDKGQNLKGRPGSCPWGASHMPLFQLNLDPGPETEMKPVVKLELQVASSEDDFALSMLYQFETRFISGLHGREILQQRSLFLLQLLWVQPEAAWMAGSPQTICVWKASLQSSNVYPTVRGYVMYQALLKLFLDIHLPYPYQGCSTTSTHFPRWQAPPGIQPIVLVPV